MKKVLFALGAIVFTAVGTTKAASFIPVDELAAIEKPAEQLSPLCQAVVKGDVELVKQYIANGVDVNLKSNGKAPAHYAARYNKAEILHLLIEGGADLNLRCDGGYTVKRHAQLSNAKSALAVIKIAEKKKA